MLEMMYNNELNDDHISQNPDDVMCLLSMWWKFIQSAPSLYASTLAAMFWKENDDPIVDKVPSLLLQYE